MRYRRSFLVISIILGFVLVWGICYSFAKDRIRQFTLDNGLKVILEENRNAPVVALQIWVNVGSGDERDEEAGMCHFIEHMMFKGTPTFPKGRIMLEVNRNGGVLNGFTSQLTNSVTNSPFGRLAMPPMALKSTFSIIG